MAHSETKITVASLTIYLYSVCLKPVACLNAHKADILKGIIH